MLPLEWVITFLYTQSYMIWWLMVILKNWFLILDISGIPFLARNILCKIMNLFFLVPLCKFPCSSCPEKFDGTFTIIITSSIHLPEFWQCIGSPFSYLVIIRTPHLLPVEPHRMKSVILWTSTLKRQFCPFACYCEVKPYLFCVCHTFTDLLLLCYLFIKNGLVLWHALRFIEL